MNEEISWSSDSMLEVTIKQPDDFLKIRETLTRIGVASRKDKTLYQSCHILHKQGKYYTIYDVPKVSELWEFAFACTLTIICHTHTNQDDLSEKVLIKKPPSQK